MLATQPPHILTLAKQLPFDVCVGVKKPERYLTTLGESIHRWVQDLSQRLLQISQHHCQHVGASMYVIQVPRIATDEWRCNGGKCARNGSTVSFHSLFPHRTPENQVPNVQWRTEPCGKSDRIFNISNRTQCAKPSSTFESHTRGLEIIASLHSSLYNTALEMITVQPSDAVLHDTVFGNESFQHRTELVATCTGARSGHSCSQHALVKNSRPSRCGHVFLRRPILSSQ